MLWNISNEAKCAEHVHEMQNLLMQLTERIATYEKQQRDHVHLSDIMFMQHKVVERKLQSAEEDVEPRGRPGGGRGEQGN